MDKFKLVSEYKPSGDQPEAIQALVNGVNWGLREQTLLGVTGSGKTLSCVSSSHKNRQHKRKCRVEGKKVEIKWKLFVNGRKVLLALIGKC